MGSSIENQCAGIIIEIIVAEISPFSSKLERVASVDVAHGVSQNEHGVATALREVAFAAEQNTEIRNPDDRQAQWRVGAKVDADGVGISLIVGREGKVNPVRTQTRFIDDGAAESMSFRNGEYLAMTVADVAKANQVCAAGRASLLTEVALVYPVAMQHVIVAEFVADISGALIDIYGSSD